MYVRTAEYGVLVTVRSEGPRPPFYRRAEVPDLYWIYANYCRAAVEAYKYWLLTKLFLRFITDKDVPEGASTSEQCGDGVSLRVPRRRHPGGQLPE